MNLDPDPALQVNPDPIQIHGFDDQKRKKKNTTEFFFSFFDQKLHFTYVQAKPSANFFYVCVPFSCPGPGTPLNPDSDLDPQHCSLQWNNSHSPANV